MENKAEKSVEPIVDKVEPVEPEVETDIKAPEATLVLYNDKADVITELKKRGIEFDARQSKAKLEELLK